MNEEKKKNQNIRKNTKGKTTPKKTTQKKRPSNKTNSNQKYKVQKTVLIDLEKEIKKDLLPENEIKEVVPVTVIKPPLKKIISQEAEPKPVETHVDQEETEHQSLNQESLPKVEILKENQIIKKRRKIFNVIIIIMAIIIIVSLGYIIHNKYQEYVKEQEHKQDLENNKKKIREIKSHYNKYVKTNKKANLYVKDKNKYSEYGQINKDIELTLYVILDDEFSSSDEYFKIENLNLYIKYSDVNKINLLTKKDDHYKKYVVFNSNIITNNQTIFYNDKGLVYTINQSFSLPIIIKETDRYYVEYNNQLLYVKKSDVKEIITNVNTTTKARTNIRTIAYHYVYDPATEKCDNTTICHSVSQFEEHMKYIHDNNYFSLTTKDMEMFLDKKIQIPTKSILITIDDGWFVARAITLLEKYKVNATLFLITGIASPDSYKSEYLEVHSHSHNLHTPGVCNSGNQGGGILCLPKETILEDLKKSREILNNTTIFCYPFYDFNDYAIEMLKEAGFKMAFIGAWGVNGLANQNVNRYKIPRQTILSTTSFNEFKTLLNY